MSRATGFLGLYAGLALVHREVAPGRSERVTVLTVELPATEYPRALEAFGIAPGDPGTGPNVLVAPARVPARPEDEANAKADAALAQLEELIEGGTLRFDVRRARRVEALANAVPFQPLRVELEPA